MNYPLVELNKSTIINNINFVKKLAKTCNVNIRPHVKTIGFKPLYRIYLENNIKQITVTSAKMAKNFLLEGYSNILMAMPVNIYEIHIIKNILKNRSLQKLILTIDNIVALKEIISILKNDNCYFAIEIDADYGRSGININDKSTLNEILLYIKNNNLQHKLYSLISHFGQTYKCKNLKEIEQINKKYIKKLLEIKNYTCEQLNQKIIASIGDTPSLPIYSQKLLREIDEIRPGNFIYYDAMQLIKGCCSLNNIAINVIAPVISIKPNYVVIHCGAIHLSKEFIKYKNKKIYGFIVDNNSSKLIGIVMELTQEHGIVKITDNISLKIGDILRIIPVHACLCVELMSLKNLIRLKNH
ncbi:MAG: hypothetical protein N3A01_03380 [Bacteroidales bacterium]|nr:hypothetical protein [Bacteroidales bacterium]